MKSKTESPSAAPRLLVAATLMLAIALPGSLKASQAYGTINNFDVVNDTGVPCHGFEIELDDITSAQITYTYDWNHYGTPVITTDSIDPAHPKTYVRYLAKYTNSAWSAYTAVPTNAIAPTQGHQFTDPSVNFGGEHFGVGYTANPTNVLYHWLQDDGTGVLKVGPAVSVSTPVFNYIAPAFPAAAPQIQPVIVPPPPPVPPVVVYEFGEATWVKMITTTTHTNNEVKLRDLVTADTNYPGVKGWANGEPAQVEFEWQVMQFDSGNTNGGNSVLNGAPESVNHGDDVVTTRYEFYKYTGPYDAETHEALAQSVAKDGIHGLASTNGGADYSGTVIVGDFIGAQMSAAALTNPVGLIDHLQDGEVGVVYPDRLVAISGGGPISVSLSGALPQGLSLNTNLGDSNIGLLTGTPSTGGAFQFSVTASDFIHPNVTKTYILSIAGAGVDLPAHAMVSASVTPAGSGTVSGTGDFLINQNSTVVAQPNAGYAFTGWSEAGVALTNATNYTLSVNANHDLTATFTNTGATNPPVTNPPSTNVVGTNSQTITFAPATPVKFSVGTVNLSATASSGLPVSFSLISGPATLSNATLSLTGAGTVTVKATQAGNSTYKAATAVTKNIVISKGSQTITFAPIGAHTYGDAPFAIGSASSSSGLTVSIARTAGPATLTSGVLTLNGAGTVTLVATQTGDSNYLAATPVTNKVVVSKASQTITFPSIANRTYASNGFAITLPTSSSGLTIALSAGPSNVVTRSGSTLTMRGVGTATLIASQAGNSNYLAATSVTNTFVISKGSQTITFNPTATNTFRTNGTITLTSTDSAGLVVSYASDNTNVLSIAGATATMKAKGTANVTASQSGNANYNAATPVTKTITLK
jgi:hypothetical protein